MDDEHSNPRIRRLCISVDVENYRRWDAKEQKAAQDALAQILDRTCLEAHIDRSAWSRQPAGDGELAVLPPGVDEGEVISRFVRNLTVQMYRHNHRLNDRAAIRLRIAMHFGMTEVAGMGFAGPAPVHAARLRDSPQLRAVMAEHPEADFGLAISQQLYDDHIGHDYPDFQVGDFRRLRIDLPEKDFSADAWLYVPPPTRRPVADGAGGERQRRPPAHGRKPSAFGEVPPGDAEGSAPSDVRFSAHRMDIGQLALRDIINSERPDPRRQS